MNDHQQNIPSRRTRREFDETFKRNAVALTLKGERSIREIANQLGIRDTLLGTWRKKYGPVPASASAVQGAMSSEEKDAEIAALRAEVIRLREREIVLKKSLGILSETPESGMPRSKR
jgi:transposase